MKQRRAKFLFSALCWSLVWGGGHSPVLARAPDGASPISIDTRVEIFVDDSLVDPSLTRDVSLRLQAPVRREVVLTTDRPWEGAASAYFTVIQDGERFRLYYRGYVPEDGDASSQQVTCYAESADGVNFTRPNLGLHEFQGSKENNIIREGRMFRVLYDPRDEDPTKRYKAIIREPAGDFRAYA